MWFKKLHYVLDVSLSTCKEYEAYYSQLLAMMTCCRSKYCLVHDCHLRFYNFVCFCIHALYWHGTNQHITLLCSHGQITKPLLQTHISEASHGVGNSAPGGHTPRLKSHRRNSGSISVKLMSHAMVVAHAGTKARIETPRHALWNARTVLR